MPARAALLPALLGALALPPGAAATPARDDLWATVNVCDTAARQGEVGVRAAMPGRPRGARRHVRFRLQWRDGDRWRYVDGADSGWRHLGRARGRTLESGWTFELTRPRRPVLFRGVVRFRWTAGHHAVRRELELTEAGHRSTAGADPEGYSAATCSIG